MNEDELLKQENEDKQIRHLKFMEAAQLLRDRGPIADMDPAIHEVLIKCLEHQSLVAIYGSGASCL